MAASSPGPVSIGRRNLLGSLSAPPGSAPPPGVALRKPNTAATAKAPSASPTPPFAVRALSKMGFGPRPGDLAAFNALGANDDARHAAYVEQQLFPDALTDTEVDARLGIPAYQTLGKSLVQLWADHEGDTDNWLVRMRPIRELDCAAFVRACHSKRQLKEVLADFWHNHFNVFGWDWEAGPVFVHYDRDVIRPNLLGNFRTMLESVASSTAMLYMLDNQSSTVSGPNENYARELLELHTLGAENYKGVIDPTSVPTDGNGVAIGYVDNDVYEVTRAFTGWSVKNGHWQYPAENDGTFVYRSVWHDRFGKFVLGKLFAANQPDLKDGRDVLDRLAAHPGTARFVVRKLCRRLIGDAPSDALVNSVAALFQSQWQAPDQLRQVTRAILLSDDFKNTWGDKVRRPFETVVAFLRATAADYTWQPDDNDAQWAISEELSYRMELTGHRPHYWPAPNGYPDAKSRWLSTGTLAMTWKLVSRLVEFQNAGSFIINVLGQTQAALTAPNRTAAKIVDYWLDRILGYQPDATQRDELIAMLGQNAGAAEALDLSTDSWNGGNLKLHYTQSRLRTTVSLIGMMPEFMKR